MSRHLRGGNWCFACDMTETKPVLFCSAWCGVLWPGACRYWNSFDGTLQNKRIDSHTVSPFLDRRTRERLQLFQDRLGDIKYRSAARIQAFYRATKGIYNSKLSAQELRMVQKRRLNACSKLQRVVRGYNGRKKMQQMRILETLRYCAAREVQSRFSGEEE